MLPFKKTLYITLYSLLLMPLLVVPTLAFAQDDDNVGARNRVAQNLFQEEIQQAIAKIKWRGERLSDDTVYAIALTGLSWQTAWGKKVLFSLASGEMKRVPSLHKRSPRETEDLIREVKSLQDQRHYSGIIRLATENFSADEIGCHPELKLAVGASYLSQGRPEQAFAVYASPYDPGKAEASNVNYNLQFRRGAFLSALNATKGSAFSSETYRKASVAFALSLLLDPDPARPVVNTEALQYLTRLGVDVDRVCLGILQAPDRLPGLPAYVYSAMDILVYRATPRMLPYFMHLTQTGDVYLKSRAILGLGVLTYTERSGDRSDWERRLVSFPIRSYGLSSGERGLIEREVRNAVQNGNFRLRTAGTLALALMGDDASVPLLQKLAKDRAYTLTPQERGHNDASRRIYFPVRMAAAAALSRFGINIDEGSGEYSGRDLDKAKRGGQDVSKDRGGLDRDSIAQVFITPIDVATAVPIEKPKER